MQKFGEKSLRRERETVVRNRIYLKNSAIKLQNYIVVLALTYIIGHNYHGHYLHAGGFSGNNYVRENKVREVNVRE